MLAALKIGVSACSAALVALLIYIFLPATTPAGLAVHSAVVQPKFVARDTVARDVAASPQPTAPLAANAEVANAQPSPTADLAKLASALKTSLAPAPVAKSLALAPTVSDEVKRDCAEGMIALANGDVAGARSLLERAAEGGDARALFVLAETYDPKTLEQFGILGAKGDAAQARGLYERALAAGVNAARLHLAAGYIDANAASITTAAAKP